MIRFWKVFRKILLFTLTGILALILLAALLTYIYEDDIKAIAIRKVNENLRSRVWIRSSDIHLTFFSTFPNTSIEFENFKIQEPGNKNILAQARLLNFQFSPVDFFYGQYHIRKILLKDAMVHLVVDSNNHPNWLIFRTSAAKKPAKETPLDIRLKNIRVENLKFVYDNRFDQQFYDLDIRKASFSGSFTDVNFELTTRAQLTANNITIGEQQYLNQKNIEIASAIDIDNQKHSYSVRNFRLKLEGAVYSANGAVISKDEGYDMDLALKGEDGNIQSIISLLPNNISSYFKDYKSTGKIDFSGTVKGIASDQETPAVNFNFKIANASIKDSRHSLGLENVNLDGNFTNGKDHTLKSSSLHLRDFSARLNNQPVYAYLAISDFSDPVAEIKLKGNLNLADVKNFTSIPDIDSMDGNLKLDAGFNGRISDLKKYSTVGRTRLNGTMELSKVRVKTSGEPFSWQDMNGNFETNGNDLLIHDFSGKYGHTDFKLNGSFRNLASFLFVPDQNLQADARLESDMIDIDDFITTDQSVKSGNQKKFELPVLLAFNFRLDAGKLKFGKFEASNVTGQMQVQDKSAFFKNVEMQTMSGSVSMNGSILDISAEQFKTNAHAVLKGIDVKKLFFEMGNFGQDYFTDQYIQGKVDAVVDYTSNWNKDLSVDAGSIVTVADIRIYDGEIHKFPQFMALGKYLKVKSLDDIQFSEYTNRIYIRNRVVEIPKMEIKSSAVNMTLAGTHTFDNVMDYKMKVNMSQLLFGNKKSYEDQFGEIEVDPNGGLNIFLTMTGPVSDYKIRYDTKSSIKNVGKGLQQEKQELKKIFKENSPNAVPGEDLNNPQDGWDLTPDNSKSKKHNTFDDQQDQFPDKPKISSQDSARKKAFDNFRNKLKKKH